MSKSVRQSCSISASCLRVEMWTYYTFMHPTSRVCILPLVGIVYMQFSAMPFMLSPLSHPRCADDDDDDDDDTLNGRLGVEDGADRPTEEAGRFVRRPALLATGARTVVDRGTAATDHESRLCRAGTTRTPGRAVQHSTKPSRVGILLAPEGAQEGIHPPQDLDA